MKSIAFAIIIASLHMVHNMPENWAKEQKDKVGRFIGIIWLLSVLGFLLSLGAS